MDQGARDERLYNDKPIHLDIRPVVSRDEARQLVDTLFHPFSLYRFENPKAGCATVLAALFTILERSYLPLAPMFISRCAMAGTGKGKLVQALARSVRALVAERDALKGQLDGNFNSATGSRAA